MKLKRCELCKNPAKTFCEADGASLCWECDERVHSANFLVAKHERSPLCHVCQSRVPWKASGAKLPLTVSVCHTCVDVYSTDKLVVREVCSSQSSENEVVEDHGEYYESSDESNDDDDVEEEEEDDNSDKDDDDDSDGENQVVPWSSALPSPPPVSSPSSSEEELGLKRTRDYSDLESQDEAECASSRLSPETVSVSMMTSDSGALESHKPNPVNFFRPQKQQRTDEEIGPEMSLLNRESSSEAVMISSLGMLNRSVISQDKMDAASTILAIRRLTRYSTTL